MKQFTLNANSWHFRMANYGEKRIGDYSVRHGTDFCTYLRAVVTGVCRAAMIFSLALAAAAWVGYSLYDIVLFLINTQREIFPTTFLFFTMAFTFGVLVLLGLSLDAHRERVFRKGIKQEDKPGFISLAYRKFKDKTCFKIKFED